MPNFIFSTCHPLILAHFRVGLHDSSNMELQAPLYYEQNDLYTDQRPPIQADEGDFEEDFNMKLLNVSVTLCFCF